MINLQRIYNLCDGFEIMDRKKAIQKLVCKGISKDIATTYYKIWRRHYLESRVNDLKLSGILISYGKVKKSLEECGYKERQKYLEAMSKEQLIKITQAVLK